MGIVWEKVETPRLRAGSTRARGTAASTAGSGTLVLDLLRAVTGPRGEDDLVSDRSWDRVELAARRRAHEPHRARPTNADRARGQRSDDDESYRRSCSVVHLRLTGVGVHSSERRAKITQAAA